MPAAIAKLRGTYRKDRHSDEMASLELPFLDYIPEPPIHLNSIGADYWQTNLRELIKIKGLIAFTDLPAFEFLCYFYQTMIECDGVLNQNGKTFQDGNGNFKTHPAWKIYNDSFKNYLLLCSHFGLTPSSRTNLKISPPENLDDDDPDIVI